MIPLKELLTSENALPQYIEYSDIPVNRKEILRYSGIPALGDSTAVDKLLDECLGLTRGKISYKIAYAYLDKETAPLSGFLNASDDLKRNMSGCRGAVLFAATLGSALDLLIRRYERSEPAKGLMFQAIGAERTESLCDLFCSELRSAAESIGMKTHPRYSPGFGDLDIYVQREFLSFLNAEKLLGITLNASYLMAPSKSLTAIVGVEEAG